MIRISESTYSRLQKLATPFTDTPATVIDRLLDHWEMSQEDRSVSESLPEADITDAGEEFSATRPPDLHHAKLLSASVGEENVRNWNELVAVAHRQAKSAGCSIAELQRISTSNTRGDKYNDSGFKFYSDIGISIQNVDANNAWKNALNLARRFDLPIEVEFQWRDKEGAAYPGKAATLKWAPDVSK